jgi:hypothetical protein
MWRVGADEIGGMLWVVRRLRAASIQPDTAPDPVRSWTGGCGLGGVCDFFADWVSATVADRRSAEAVVRFYGLVQLPEDQDTIARTLSRRESPSNPGVPRALGVSTRQVQHLIRAGIQAMASRSARPPVADGPLEGVRRRVDPFPGPWRAPQVQRYRALLWGWAQVPEGGDTAAKALLLYEFEHGVRAAAPQPVSRTDRQRWRNLAWSILDVAAHRVALAAGPSLNDGQRLVDHSTSLRLLVIGDTDLSAPMGSTGAFASLLGLPPWATPIALIEDAVELARHAVRERLPEAPQLVGVLTRAVTRVRLDRGSERIPVEVTSKLSALSAILSREHRDIGGVAIAEAALLLNERHLHARRAATGPEARAIVLSDMLRLSQELAELAAELTLPFTAWRTLRNFRRLLETYGDPEDEAEPGGWLHVLQLTRARVERSMAQHSTSPLPWLQQAATHADRSALLALGSGLLPVPWGIEALSERINTTLDMAGASEQPRLTTRLVTQGEALIKEATNQLASVTPSETIEYKKARLRLQLATWRVALLAGDLAGAAAARAEVVGGGVSWLVAADVAEIQGYDQETRRLGAPLDDDVTWPTPMDRHWLRPPTR